MAASVVTIRVSGLRLIDKMKAVGFSENGQFLTLSVCGDDEKQRVIGVLIDKGALFLYGHGWYPSEVLRYYEDQGIDFGRYKVVYWTDRDTYHTEER